MGAAAYMAGAAVGFAVGVVIVAPASAPITVSEAGDWVALNLGHSSWIFATVLVLFLVNLVHLRSLLIEQRDHQRIVRLDQLSDVWIHVFVGVGVIWTAVGMRSALSATLTNTATLSAGDVLTRLVDGGILLALTTTIVGAMGGYLMRLYKTIFLGAELVAHYNALEKNEMRGAIDRLALIEGHLQRMTGRRESPGSPDDQDHAVGESTDDPR